MTSSSGVRQTARVSTDSAATRVAESLRERVSSGQLGPGTALSQAGLAEEYGVSRIPVRDALQQLAGEGLVEVRGSTSVVTPLSIDDLQELYELREAVEPVATRLAVPRVGRAGVARMTRSLAVMDDPTIGPGTWVRTNAAFHAEVYTLAGRPRMIALVEQLRRLTDRYVYFHLDVVGRVGHLQEEHRQILDAVRAQDASAAAELTRAHLASSHAVVLDYLLAQERDSGVDA
ncbi:GntR family transcriptional regulator [Plantactinospora mayteni]|uniref:GntR family transcriptional regulator n=1 Tax=Plantactinospora mayteni TaxID=566021 RepID=A0ABQ4F1E4_9ACTN|nr:GntR family transcriptional regulator [Plantactinospora mayteni]GIH00741.1 GntR family transcriptional regulator [Plantactinospora mayteni]